MVAPASAPDSRWATPTPETVVTLLQGTGARWWLSGGAALDRWLGEPIRKRPNTDVSTTQGDLAQLVDGLPVGLSAWAPDGDALVPWPDAPRDTDLQPVQVHDDEAGVWVLRVNAEDGVDRAWVYKRDPRLQLPWSRAVQDIAGIPTGAPEVQLVWKALRPRPEDDIDKDAVLPRLSEEARTWFERAILSIHPHSSWSIGVRSPMFPARASWNRRDS